MRYISTRLIPVIKHFFFHDPKKYLVMVLLSTGMTYQASGQSTELLEQLYKQKTGNGRDMLTDLFRLAIRNLGTNNAQVDFTSTLYALRAKNNQLLAIDKNYVKEKFSRNFQVSAGVKTDETTKDFRQGVLGLSYALINNRDKSVADFHSANDFDLKIADIISVANFGYLNKKPPLELLEENMNLAGQMMNQTSTELISTYKSLDPVYRHLLDSAAIAVTGKKQTIANLIDLRRQEYLDQAEMINRKALLLAGTGLAYDFTAKSMSQQYLDLQFLKGLGKDPAKKPVELEMKCGVLLGTDTSAKKANLDRSVLRASTGLNGILVQDANSESILEMKLFISYDKVLKGSYAAEKKEIFSGNAAFRMKVTKDIWIPVTLTYDITNANFLGFLNVVWNLEK